MGDDLDPEAITGALGIAPSRAARRGEMMPVASGARAVPARTGRWDLKADPRSDGDLEGQIEGLLAGLTDNLAAWREIRSTHRVSVFCGVFMEDWNEGVVIRPETLEALGSRGIRLELDIYGPDTAREQPGSAPP